MARPKRLGFRKKSIPMTALLLAGAFAAGSATFLAVHDSVVPEDATVQEYRLEMPSPAGSSVTVPDGQQPQEEAQEQQPQEQAQEQQPQEQAQEQQPQEQQELVAVDPGTPSTQQEQPEPDELAQEAVSASASNDTQVLRLYVRPVDGEIVKPWSDGELVFSETLGDYRVHNGIDIAASVGTKVRAMADGVIADIYDDDLLGRVVEITHADGTVGRYCNLQQAGLSGITAGASVKMGDVIGGVGESALGESGEQPHLHLEVERQGQHIDPQQLFE